MGSYVRHVGLRVSSPLRPHSRVAHRGLHAVGYESSGSSRRSAASLTDLRGLTPFATRTHTLNGAHPSALEFSSSVLPMT